MIPWIFVDALVVANPIPIPTLLMPEEYINATITRVDGVVSARVNGTYPFQNMGHDYVAMYYPVPPDASNLSVAIDETPLSWAWNGTYYPTIIGDYPFIEWLIYPVPYEFTIDTFYEHPVPLLDGNYTFLYAMGTGRYLQYYAKETTAYVRVSITKDIAPIESYIDVYTVTEQGMWNPADYTITEEDETWIVTLTVVSEEFLPLEEDLLITIADAILGDVNRDGYVNIFDLLVVRDAIGSEPGDPNWNPLADLNGDGYINIYDLLIVRDNIG